MMCITQHLDRKTKIMIALAQNTSITADTSMKILVIEDETKTVNYLRQGLTEDHIAVSPDCTVCLHDKYWSHRFTKGERGSQGAAIALEWGKR